MCGHVGTRGLPKHQPRPRGLVHLARAAPNLQLSERQQVTSHRGSDQPVEGAQRCVRTL
jgi:hypothetical protein